MPAAWRVLEDLVLAFGRFLFDFIDLEGPAGQFRTHIRRHIARGDPVPTTRLLDAVRALHIRGTETQRAYAYALATGDLSRSTHVPFSH